MVYFASGGSSGAITFSSAGLFASAGFIASAGFSASAGFIASAGFFATTGSSGIIAHAKPCASHKKKLAKRHTETRPAQKNTTWPSVLAEAYNPIKKKAKVAIEKPTA